MKKADIPSWMPGVHLSEQPASTRQFWHEEARKIKFGLKIDGTVISSWLYFHLNHWRMYVDRMDSRGSIVRVSSLPDLRDNEWIFQEMLLRAEAQKKGITVFGSRRIGKSCFISSKLAHASVTKKGSDNVVIGGTKDDLETIANYTDWGLLNLHEFMRYRRTGTDWDKGVEFGTRNVDNTKNVFSRISIRNVNRGKTESSQAAAGTTTTAMIFDEIGKYPVMTPFLAAKHSLSTPYGWRDVPLLVGTAGEVELAQDAIEIFGNPDLYNMMEMDWELLSRHCSAPTWKPRKCCIFIPGQMSLDPHCGEKDVTTLDRYLGVNSAPLSRIEIRVTNWDRATRNLDAYFAELDRGNKKVANTERMYLPRDVEDMFISAKNNPFPVALGTVHRAELMERGETGKCVELYTKADGMVGYGFSDKLPVDKFPFPGGTADAPTLIFEDPPQDRRLLFNHTYTSGLDFYKTAESSTSSLGAFYVYKRMVDIKDPWAGRIVASYTARPSMMENHHRSCEMLQEAYGCMCLMEGIDIAYETYLTRKQKDMKLLAGGLDLAHRNINTKAAFQYKYGLPAIKYYTDYVMRLVIDYTWTEFGEKEIVHGDGTKTTRRILGIEMIPDIYLLEEIINFRYGMNVDRIVAFGHALALARYYDTCNYVPKTLEQLDREETMRKAKPSTGRIGAFGSMRVGAFK
jgi:hypothetical protein